MRGSPARVTATSLPLVESTSSRTRSPAHESGMQTLQELELARWRRSIQRRRLQGSIRWSTRSIVQVTVATVGIPSRW